MNLNQLTPQMLMQNSKAEVCTGCGGKLFVPCVAIRRISRVYTGEQADGIVPMQLFACKDCGMPIEDMLPPDFFDEPKMEQMDEAKTIVNTLITE